MAKTKGRIRPVRRKSLQWHFFEKSLVVGLSLLVLTISALAAMLSSYNSHHAEQQALRLARSIDAVAMFTSRPNQLQHYVQNFQESNSTAQITVISAAGNSGFAVLASSDPARLGYSLQQLPSETRAAIEQAFKTNLFQPRLRLGSGTSISILPLSSALGQLNGNIPLGLAKTMTPQWYSLVDEAIPSVMSRIWSPAHLQVAAFHANPRNYSGAIVIAHPNGWTSGLMLDVFLETSALILISFTAVVAAGWSICRRYVTKPVGTLSDVLAQLRRGKRRARAPRFAVKEFDALARQWNGLLNFRQQAEQNQEIFSTIIENVPVGIEITTTDGHIEYANPAYQEICGKPLIEIVGKTPAQIFRSSEMDAGVLKDAEVHIASGKPWRGEIKSLAASGGLATFDVSLSPVLDARGNVERVVAVRQDITKRIEHENELIQAKLKSEAADKAKSEFINCLSHELRTPFNAIIGFSSMIYQQQMGPVGNPSYIEFATLIEQSAEGLLETINTLIELSRVDSPASSRGDATMDPASAVHRVVRSKSEKAGQIGITISVDDRLESTGLLCDERHLQTITEKLLCNALKFNHKGGRADITLKLNAENRVVLEVSDTGIGIVQEDIARVTEPFFQSANGVGRGHDGLGVGLTLVQHLVNVYNAELKILSDPGTGTRVKIIFPAERTVEPSQPIVKPAKNKIAA